jgi:phage terminase small subunit
MPRPPKSAKLTLLEGNKSRYVKAELERRAANEDKLKIRSENIVPPSWLDADSLVNKNYLVLLGRWLQRKQ